MNTKSAVMRRGLFSLLVATIFLFTLTGSLRSQAYAQGISAETPHVEVVNPYFSIEHTTLSDGRPILKYIIHGPAAPLEAYEAERAASIRSTSAAIILPNFPSFNWVFGCSAVSGAMIAGYYDRGAYPNMYTGPTNGGVMPLTDTSWATWSDGWVTYPNNPLIASHIGVDGRATRGSIDDYWVKYDSTAADPYITGGWVQHTWGTAIGDYMKTSQSAAPYLNPDGSTAFYNNSDNEKLTCSQMEEDGLAVEDGTYGRKLFYEARGYTVTDCFNQRTDNLVAGGFSLANFQAEINAGHAVLLNLAGHSIVGYGYDGSTVYIRDTWDSNPANTYTMPWGGSYDGMLLQSVSVVHLASAPLPGSDRAYIPFLIKEFITNRAPTGIQISNSSVQENLPLNTVVGTLTTTDSDVGDTFTYSLVSGAGDTGNGSFNISGNQLRSSVVFDYETQNSYSIRVRTTDQGGMFYEKVFSITITNVAEVTLLNGNFEQGNVAWTEYSSNGFALIVLEDPEFITVPVLAHGGDWLAWLGGAMDETSRLSQTFSVPAGSSYLHYWYWIASGDYCNYDYFWIKVNSTTMYTRTLCGDTDTGGWVEGSLSLAAYVNTTITLMFEVTTNSSLNSNLFLDDVSLSSSAVVSPEVSVSGGEGLEAIVKER
jgi:hypothetical protein